MRNRIRRSIALLAGAGFIFLALVSIQYQEVVTPGIERLADRWPAVSATLSKTPRYLSVFFSITR